MRTTTDVPRNSAQQEPAAQQEPRPSTNTDKLNAPAGAGATPTDHVDATVSTFRDLPLLLTVPETARVLRIGRNGAYEAVKSGTIPSINIGSKIRVPRKALAAWIGDTDHEGYVDPTSVPTGEDAAAPRGASLGEEAERTA